MSHPRTELYAENERLARAFYSNGRYNPYFLFLTAVGLSVIYGLTFLGVFGQPAPQLILIAALTLVLAILQFPLLALARRNRGIAVTLWGTFVAGIFAILLTCLWQGVLPISILLVIVTPISALRNGLPRRYILAIALLVALTIAAIIYVE